MIKNILRDEKLRSFIKESWAISWPMTLIMLFEFLIGLTDVYVAGKLGKETQAAYGLAFQMYFIFILVGMAISVGTVSVTSRLFTSGRHNEFILAIKSSMFLSCAAGIIFGLTGFTCAGFLIGIFNINDSVKLIATPLLRIYAIGFLFDYILICLNAVLRSSGLIKKSLLAMTVACALNIILDFLLVLKTPLGFTGIAWATVISLFTGAVIALWFANSIVKKWLGISITIIKEILSISWPSGILQIMWQLSSATLFFIIGLLPLNNIETMAAFTNGLRIESAIFLPAFAFNMANAVIVGNMLGKKKGKDAFKSGMITALLGVVLVTILTIIIMLNAKRIASLLSPNDIVVAECAKYIYIALIFEPITALSVILGGALNGAGDTKGVMGIVVISVWLIRIPSAYILGIILGFGATAIWWSMNLSILIQCCLITRRYLKRRWLALIPEPALLK